MRVRSIRRRLVVTLLAGSALLVFAAGLSLGGLVARRLRQEFDRALLAKARALVTLTVQHRGEVEIDFADEFMPEFEAPERPEYFQLWLAGGPTLERSRSLGARDLPRSADLASAPRFRDLRLPDGRPGRLVEVAFVPQVEDDEEWPETAFDPAAPPPRLRSAVLAVARGREDLDGLIRSLYAAGAASAALLVAGLALLVHFAVRGGLAPLAAVGRQVQALDADRLDGRIAVEPPTRELLPVIEQLNALLGRLQSAFERERRFAGDVAHELRTPVAELRSLAEVGRRWPEDREAVEGFFADVAAIARQMEGIVTTLLALARCEAGLERPVPSRFALPELVEETWAPLAAEAAGKDVRLALETAPGAAVVCDREKLGLVLGNLLANAVAYSPPGSTVACTARGEDGWLEITVANPAPHLGAADLPHLFERFWRKDPARSNGQHAGLGLALARSFAALLGLDLTANLTPDQRLELRLTAKETS
ncbi:MAG TPA: ATP-binding protein [Thermoanaerobaculia bacterium]|nr:ATP-binding protein [Thermoanaerobaculia bacterium]